VSQAKKAEDLLPLVQELPPEERVRLARLVLQVPGSSPSSDVDAYRREPPHEDEFSTEDDPLAREGNGWEAFYAPG
jgi:hypothetical protein